MAKRDILKEAIADAKAVKEVAIENAKAALEEAFTPQLKSMLAAKIQEMDLEEEDLDTKTNVERHGDKGDTDPKEIETEKMAKKLEEDDEVNLDEILAELEGDLSEESEDERADVDKYEYEEGKEEGEDEDEDEETDEIEDEEVDLEDMTDDDLKTFIEDVITDMVDSGELEAGENFEEETETETETEEVEVELAENEEVDEHTLQGFTKGMSIAGKGVSDAIEAVKGFSKDQLEAIVKWYEEAKANPASPLQKKLRDAGTGKKQSFQNRFEEAIDEKTKELKEAYATIKTLRSNLYEVNLLNAKLLYTNKIFKAKSLTETQKIKVLGAFDKATTVKETKLVFETLNEGLKTKRTPIKESLGSASKSTGNFRKIKKPIIATDPMVERFQKLAGLK